MAHPQVRPMQARRSQACVYDLIDVGLQVACVHRGKHVPPGQQRFRRQWGIRHSSQLSDCLSGPRDRDLLATGSTVDDITTVVT